MIERRSIERCRPFPETGLLAEQVALALQARVIFGRCVFVRKVAFTLTSAMACASFVEASSFACRTGGKADAHAEHLRSQRAVAAEKAEEAWRRCKAKVRSRRKPRTLEVRAQIRAKQQGGALDSVALRSWCRVSINFHPYRGRMWQMQTREVSEPRRSPQPQLSRAGPSNSAAAEALGLLSFLGWFGHAIEPYPYELDSSCLPAYRSRLKASPSEPSSVHSEISESKTQ